MIRLFVSLLFLISLWELLFLLIGWPDYLFPTPYMVFEALTDGFINKPWLFHLFISLKRLFIGYSLSITLGAILSLLILQFPKLLKGLEHSVLSFQSLPSLAWLPLAVIWFGLQDSALIFVLIMGSIFTMTTSFIGSFRQIPQNYLELSQMMNLRGFNYFTQLLLPASAPSLLIGLRQSWSFAWRSLLAAELFLSGSGGLGYLLQMSRDLNNISDIMAILFILMVIGFITDQWVFGRLEKLPLFQKNNI